MEERPAECRKCRKRADVLYKEIIEGEVIAWKMCQDCPTLRFKLKGETKGIGRAVDGGAPRCAQCHTSLESISAEGVLGCGDCYQTFQDILTDQLVEIHRLTTELTADPTNRTLALHVGRAPGKDNPPKVSRIQDLNEALNEALKIENYEEAAWLRDQINVLMGKLNERA